MRKSIRISLLVLCIAFFISSTASAADKIRFGVPPWPGVTVKTAVVTQLLDTIGYETTQLEVGPPIIYKGMTTDDIDVFLAAWDPAQEKMLKPALEKGDAEILATNLDEAMISLCVPTYVADAGVKSMADLDKYADKFDHTIYNIEIGAGMQTTVETYINEDVVGLGDWSQVNSTTPVMLGQAQDIIKSRGWVVFGCWKPHWMDVLMDIHYLEGVPATEALVSKSLVHTVARKGFAQEQPEAARFLKQIYVPGKVQSQWIYEFGHEKKQPEAVAREWISANLETVAKWMKGVKASDGSNAMDAVTKAYK